MWFCSASVCRLGFCYDVHIWKTGELKSFLYRSFCKSSSLPPCPPVLTKWRRVGELWIDNRQKGFLGWPGKSEGLSRLSMRPATGKWVTYPGNQNKIRPEAAKATRCGAGSRGPKGQRMGVWEDGVSGNTWNRYIKGQDHLNCRKDSTVNGGLADWKAGVWARFPLLVCGVEVVEFLARGRATQLPQDCSWENSWSEIPPPCSLSAWIPGHTFPKHLSSWLCLRLPLPSATSLCQVPPSAFGVPKDSRPSPPGLSDLQPLSIAAEQIRHSSFSHLTQEEQESQSPKSGSRASWLRVKLQMWFTQFERGGNKGCGR